MAVNNTRRLAGIASVSIDGTFYDLVGDLVYSPTVIKRESLVGQDGFHGYSEMPQVGHIAMRLRDNGGITIGDFNQFTFSTVQAFLANGKGVVGTGMYTVEAQEVNTVEGVFELRFEGPDVFEATV